MDLRNPNAGIDMSVRRSIMQVKMRKTYFVAYATIVLTASVFAERGLAELRGKLSARPVPRPALAARLAEGPEIIGIVLSSTTESGETDTAKWMTAEQ